MSERRSKRPERQSRIEKSERSEQSERPERRPRKPKQPTETQQPTTALPLSEPPTEPHQRTPTPSDTQSRASTKSTRTQKEPRVARKKKQQPQPPTNSPSEESRDFSDVSSVVDLDSQSVRDVLLPMSVAGESMDHHDLESVSVLSSSPTESTKVSDLTQMSDLTTLLEMGVGEAGDSEHVELKPLTMSALLRGKLKTNEEFEAMFNQVLLDASSGLELAKSINNSHITKNYRALIKDVKRLKSNSLRVMRRGKRGKRNRVNRTTNKQSGILKPVVVSLEICQFTGWSPDELHSRVEVTRFLCNYIKENNLQNPLNRREIIPDEALRRLLNYDELVDGVPLTYFYIQKKIQVHFPKRVVADVDSVVSGLEVVDLPSQSSLVDVSA